MMVCPFRIIRKTEYRTTKDSDIIEEYAPCYKADCPFYYTNVKNGKEQEGCNRKHS